MKALGLALDLNILGQVCLNYTMKLPLQKSTSNEALVRKSPRVRYDIGLQWELSGNQVV